MSVQAWFSSDDVAIDPGSGVTLPLTVENLGDVTESYTIVPAGLAAGWTSVSRGNITLFGGSQEVIDVEVTPPALSTTTAGATAIAVRIIPAGDADDAVVAETTVDVEPFDDCRLVPLQPIQRARHRATYEFMVENHGNTVVNARLHLVDATERIDGDFDPPAVGVAPGGASLVRLRARARREAFRRSTRTIDFEIEAARQGSPPVAASLALVQSPTIPGTALLRAAAVLAALLGLVAAWFVVVEPAIEDAAASEVDERVAEFEATIDDGETAVVVPDTTVPDDAETEGEPEFFRLAVNAPLTQAASEATTMPDGRYFDMTDVRIENAFDDRGVASLLVNDEQVFVWSLESVRGSFFEPRITAIRLEPGDNVAFSVRCDEIGDATRSTCTTAINVGGLTYPVDGA